MEKIKKFIREHFSDHGLIIRFLISGGSAAVVQITFLYIFTDFFGIFYLVSAALAFIVAIFVSFSLQKFWAFKNKGMTGINKQFSLYIALQVTNVGLNTLGLFILVDILSLWYILAQLLMGLVITLNGFLVYKFFIFLPKKDEVTYYNPENR